VLQDKYGLLNLIMDQFELKDYFKPNLDDTIDNRLAKFREELLFIEEEEYKYFFENRPPVNDTDNHDRLWNHYFLEKKGLGNSNAGFGFYDESELDYKTKEKLFKIFWKHFPNGVQGSLIGYPQTLGRNF